MTRKLQAADLFCGAGGTSAGAERTGEARVVFAVNHWDVAVQTHSANFPHTRHINSRLDQVRPSECPQIDLLFASPECTHHSRARGGRPTSDQQRAGAWELLPWIDHHRPRYLVVENVCEFQDWGPVDPRAGRPLPKFRGRFFEAWVNAIRAAGYQVDWKRLNAADFGAATSRVRLFIVARKGNRAVRWPEATHAKVERLVRGAALFEETRQPWHGAWEVIDWSLPCPSLFSRARPLADKTLLRIEAGLHRFVGPFLAHFDNHGGHGSYIRSCAEPLSTVVTKTNIGVAVPFVTRLRNHGDAADIQQPLGVLTAGGKHHGLAVPYVVPYRGENDQQRPWSHDLRDPMPTVATALGHGLAVPFLANVNHGGAEHRTSDLQEAIGAVTAKNGRCLVVPFIAEYYGSGGQWSGIGDPVDTVPMKARHSLIQALIDPTGTPPARCATDTEQQLVETMRELSVIDIGFRMLANHELAAAQGFDQSYVFHGTKSEVTRQIGNSVSPNVAAALTEAIAA